jgi:hypothetical protein
MIPAFGVDPYLIAQYLKAIDMCLTDLLTKMQNVLKHSMFAECFPILDSRNASRAIIKLGEQCMSLARCVINGIVDWVSTLHYLGAQWASPPSFRNLKQTSASAGHSHHWRCSSGYFEAGMR